MDSRTDIDTDRVDEAVLALLWLNLSATGVFIQTTNLGLRKGQQVELSFAINLGTVTKIHRRTAIVAHVSRGGTGLMMDAYSHSHR